MTFHNVLFPVNISYGSSGGPGYNTSVITLDSGAEERIQRWSQPRHVYDASSGIKSRADYAQILEFYHARAGAAHSFRWKDWADFTSADNTATAVTNTDQVIGAGDTSTTTFQLVKKYASGTGSTTRTIVLPVSGTVVIALDGVNQTSGWSVSTTTGIVTFTSPPGAGVAVTAGFQFEVPVRFDSGADEALTVTLEAFNALQLASIPIIEVFDETVAAFSEPFYGGCTNNGATTSTLSIGLTDGFIFMGNPDTAAGDVVVNLPTPGSSPLGGPYFLIVNTGSGSNDYLIKQPAGTTILALTSGNCALVFLSSDGTKPWICLSSI